MKKEKKWYKRISSWLIIILTIILVPILVINIWIMVQAKSNPDKIPSVFGYKPFIVLSGSMETEIHKGDLIITKNVDPKTLKTNDVIAFRDQENTVTTHRIIDIVEDDGETYFITKGDNNDSQDQNLVEYKDIEGIYTMRIPSIGNVMNTLAEPTTIIIILMGVTMIFVIGFTLSTKKQRDLEREEYLEYKKMKEEEAQIKAEKKEKANKQEEVKKETNKTKKTTSQKKETKQKTAKTASKKNTKSNKKTN